MSESILRINSISEFHRLMGFDEPKHPLISVINVEDYTIPEEFIGQKMTGPVYSIMLKDESCGLVYGRNHYDFEEGVLIFTAPNQVVASQEQSPATRGWMLFFHPDLIRRSPLATTIHNYSFFSYDVHEALHLSKKEENILNDCVQKIVDEYNENIDAHSQTLFVSNLELMLNYCNRFYERQFNTRSNHHLDIVAQVEQLLRTYYKDEVQLDEGLPTVSYLADRVHLSSNYLSDLLKKETGRNAKDHISYFVIEEAKTRLLNSEEHVSEIAYDLGYNYPHYFSRAFKKHTGLTPQKFREVNLN